MAEGVRYGLLLRTCMEVLRDAGRPVPGRDVLEEVARRIDLNDEERQVHKTGGAKWVVALGFHSGDATTAGWLVKQEDKWWITEAGVAALDTYQTPEDLIGEVHRRYREVFRSRKQARKKYAGSLNTLASALDLVPAGSWTAHDDLAALIGGDADEVAHLLAGEPIPNSHRVLTADGRVPAVHHQHARYRGANLEGRLITEGVEFEGGRARQDQRITADLLSGRLAEAAAPESSARRSWLVRGSNVDGVDVVPAWLAEGLVSVAASQLPDIGPVTNVKLSDLQRFVEEGYRHKNYSVREKLVAEFWAFLSLMRKDDHLVTVHRGNVYSAWSVANPTSSSRRTTDPTCAGRCGGSTRTNLSTSPSYPSRWPPSPRVRTTSST